MEKNLDTPESRTDKTDKTPLAKVAHNVAEQFCDQYAHAREAERLLVLSAVKDKATLPNDYWRPAHVARLKALAASAFADALDGAHV